MPLQESAFFLHQSSHSTPFQSALLFNAPAGRFCYLVREPRRYQLADPC